MFCNHQIALKRKVGAADKFFVIVLFQQWGSASQLALVNVVMQLIAMAEQEQVDEQNQEGNEKKGSPLMLLLIVSVVAIGAGIGTPFGIKYLSSAEEKPKEQAEDQLEEFEFVEFGEVVVNIDEPRLTRYLRLNISLQVSKEDKDPIAKAIEKNSRLLKDWLNGYLADQKMDAIRGQAGQNRMRREIKDQFNSVLFPDGYERIHGVLFLEFNVQ